MATELLAVVNDRVPVLPQLIALACVHVIVMAGRLSSWTPVVHLSQRTIGSASFRRAMDRVTGVALIALGYGAGSAARQEGSVFATGPLHPYAASPTSAAREVSSLRDAVTSDDGLLGASLHSDGRKC